MIIEDEVGLHHASPPPPHCGYCLSWICWEYFGTSSTMPLACPGVLATAVSGRVEATKPRERTSGVIVVPAVRYSVTRSWIWFSPCPSLAENVSVYTDTF